MSRRKQRSAFDQVSEFDRGSVVACRDCGFSFLSPISYVSTENSDQLLIKVQQLCFSCIRVRQQRKRSGLPRLWIFFSFTCASSATSKGYLRLGDFNDFKFSNCVFLVFFFKKRSVMSRRKQRSAFDQVSEFDRGSVVACRDCGFSFLSRVLLAPPQRAI
ncbi:uncharacterized protein TNCV_2412671 [Trichonephila clavipes]|nr:uncharacterized protein TNCV_2412671 [Trichonephila clavipes]